MYTYVNIVYSVNKELNSIQFNSDANKKMSQTELKKVRASATLFNGHALQVKEGKQLTIGFGLVAQVFCPAKHSRFVSAAIFAANEKHMALKCGCDPSFGRSAETI